LLRSDVKKIPYLLLLACLLRVLHIPPSLAYQYEQGVIWWVFLIAYIALWLESEQNTVYIKFVKNNVHEMDRNYLIPNINKWLFTMKVENQDTTKLESQHENLLKREIQRMWTNIKLCSLVTLLNRQRTRYKILYFPNQGPWRAWYTFIISTYIHNK
jgi:hypothetical protein